MKFVFASDSFKGTLSSARIGELLETAAREVVPDAECVTLPLADGGEGTLAAIEAVRPGARVSCASHDGLMRPVSSDVFICGDEAFVEAAASCGLTLLAPVERDPLATSSYGVGECSRAALDHGCRRITVGLGGSCTNDGGMGCLRALGMRSFEADGSELLGRGADLERVARIDDSALDARVRDASFAIMGDVRNPLLGPNGATCVFGPQKGADKAALERLEAGMRVFAEAVAAVHPTADFATAGYGAAGGLGMALAVFLGAEMRSGIEELLRWIDFDGLARGADLVVTGEGRLDGQSMQGKVVSGVVAHAQKIGVPVAVICGSSLLDAERVRELGLFRVLEMSARNGLAYAMDHAEEAYLCCARELFAGLRFQ